jgi:hypothetical protein
MMKDTHDSFINSMQFNPNKNKAYISDALEIMVTGNNPFRRHNLCYIVAHILHLTNLYSTNT